MKKEIEAFVNAASEQELDAAWNNLSAEEQRVFEQLMISCHDFPSYRLLKRTPQEFDNLFNGLVADIGGNGLSGLGTVQSLT